MAKVSTSESLEKLAAEIGENVYLDIAKWHLYLQDAHLHSLVAEQIYPLLVENHLSEGEVLNVLQSIPVKVGGGKRDIPLVDLIPTQCQVNLMDILEEFQRNM